MISVVGKLVRYRMVIVFTTLAVGVGFFSYLFSRGIWIHQERIETVNGWTESVVAACSGDFVQSIPSCLLAYRQILIQHRLGNIARVIKGICPSVLARLPAKTWNQCVFNFGTVYALSYIEADPASLGQMSRQAVDWCTKTVGVPADVAHCVAGVVNGVGAYYIDHPELFLENPLTLCAQYPERFTSRCYDSLVSLLYERAGKDIGKASDFLFVIPEKNERLRVMGTLASTAAFRSISSQKIVSQCYMLQEEFVGACIQGYATGLVEVGGAGKEDEAAVVFCLTLPRDELDRTSCIKRVYKDVSSLYPLEGGMRCRKRLSERLHSLCPQ